METLTEFAMKKSKWSLAAADFFESEAEYAARHGQKEVADKYRATMLKLTHQASLWMEVA